MLGVIVGEDKQNIRTIRLSLSNPKGDRKETGQDFKREVHGFFFLKQQKGGAGRGQNKNRAFSIVETPLYIKHVPRNAYQIQDFQPRRVFCHHRFAVCGAIRDLIGDRHGIFSISKRVAKPREGVLKLGIDMTFRQVAFVPFQM
jgi:hypothetical protein